MIIDMEMILIGWEETTGGIDIQFLKFNVEDKKKFRINIWDFGGQEIYHSTHQFL